jgi:hypothetical protein
MVLAFTSNSGSVEYGRRTGAGSLKFCSGKGKKGEWPGTAGNELATKGHKKEDSFLLSFVPLVSLLWQWRFAASLLPDFANSESGGDQPHPSR